MHSKSLVLAFVLTSVSLLGCGDKAKQDPASPEPAAAEPAPVEPAPVEPAPAEPAAEPSPAEGAEDLPPGACESSGGTCAETTCEERGTEPVEGTCYLNGEPQTNLYCCK